MALRLFFQRGKPINHQVQLFIKHLVFARHYTGDTNTMNEWMKSLFTRSLDSNWEDKYIFKCKGMGELINISLTPLNITNKMLYDLIASSDEDIFSFGFQDHSICDQTRSLHLARSRHLYSNKTGWNRYILGHMHTI